MTTIPDAAATPIPARAGPPDTSAQSAAERRQRLRLPVAAVLALGFGALVLLSGVALYLALAGGFHTTVGLLRERNERILSGLVEKIQTHLDPVRAQVEFLAARVERDGLDPADAGRLEDFLAASLAGVPQVATVSFVDKDLGSIRVERRDGGIATRQVDLRSFPGTAERVAETSRRSGPYWGDLIWNPDLGLPMINLRTPVRREGRFLGGMIALVSLGSLSRFLANPELGGGEDSFILYDGDKVLAHASLAAETVKLPHSGQLPRVGDVGDPVLAAIWSGQIESGDRFFPAGEGHLVQAAGNTWVFVYRKLEGFGEQSWLVGRYFPLAELGQDVAKLKQAAMIGLALLALAFVVALVLGRVIGPPVRRLAEAAAGITSLNFEGPSLGRSFITEIDQANGAFDASRAALRWFGNYVPRRLVARLMAEGDGAGHSRRTDVTILFTDIAGFTTLAERLSETETADFLNCHFALIASCVEAEGGVVDKFIGDGVMATWGAISGSGDHAERACRAARAIAVALVSDNAARRRAGLPPVRLRIGLHSGPVIAGNIGAPGRINFTVVGDSVNQAQRLEDLGRLHHAPGEDVVILASGATVDVLGDRAGFEPLGLVELRGRQSGVQVYRARSAAP